MSRSLKFMAALVIALLPSAGVWAQAATGIVAGTVQDSSGGAVPGAIRG